MWFVGGFKNVEHCNPVKLKVSKIETKNDKSRFCKTCQKQIIVSQKALEIEGWYIKQSCPEKGHLQCCRTYHEAIFSKKKF